MGTRATEHVSQQTVAEKGFALILTTLMRRVVLPWAHAWFCLASYFKHISWKIRFYGTLGLVPHITQELEREITQLAEEDHSGLEEPPDLAASGSSDSDETSNSDGSQRDRERGPFDPVSVMDPEAPSDDSDPETPPVRIRK